MNHHDFAFDATFGESAGNLEVYRGTAQQLVFDVLNGKSSTVMMRLSSFRRCVCVLIIICYYLSKPLRTIRQPGMQCA